jgi:hypothetical protein
VKLIACGLAYLRFQLIGVAFAPLVIALLFARNVSAFLHIGRYRYYAFGFAGVVVLITGLFGIVAAIWKWIQIWASEQRDVPPGIT